jgi:hypothetical protein
MRDYKLVLAMTVATVLVGCGTYVPDIQEFPGDSADGQLFVQAIVQNVTCEVQDAINDIIRKDREDAKTSGVRNAAWLDNWGVQMLLTLTVDETGKFNPTGNWFPPSPETAIFNLNVGINAGATATRTDKVGSYYTVRELLKLGPCNPSLRPRGPFLLQSDLKLRQWLLYNVMLGGTGVVLFPTVPNGPLKQDVISHEVKFEVVSEGSVTPAWKLTRVLINQDGTLLTAGRTRTHDLLITLGPTDPATLRGRRLPAPAAANAHLASQIGLAVSNGLRTGVRP